MTQLNLTASERERVDRIDALVAWGAGGVDELVAALDDRSWTVRRAAVAGLAALGDDAVGRLCEWLRTDRSSEHAIAGAVDALSTSIGSSATAAVAEIARAAAGPAVEDAARILGRRRAVETAPILCKLLEHPSDNVALAAIEALGQIGNAAGLDALIDVARGRNFFRTFPAMQVLARSGDARAIAPLAELLDDDVYREEAVRALGHTGDSRAIAPLAAVAATAAPPLLRAVGEALAELIERSAWIGAAEHVRSVAAAAFRPSTSRIIAALPGAEPAERNALVAVLGVIGDASAFEVLAPLVADPVTTAAALGAIESLCRVDDGMNAALASPDPTIRAAALSLLRTGTFVPVARSLLHDEAVEVRARACEALARLGDVASVPQLFELLADANPRVALAASGAINALGGPQAPGLALAALGAPEPNVRRHALRILAYIGPRDAFEAVLAAVDDDDPRVGELAVAALAALGDPRADQAIRTLARDPRDAIRSAAMRAAAHRELVDLLVAGVGDRAAWVRYYACQGLARQRSAPLELLRSCLADPAPQVRIAALEGLARQDDPEARELLLAAAGSEDPDVRRAALVGVARRGGSAELAVVRAALSSPDLATRMVALDGLAHRPEPEALADVAAAIADPDLREAALSHLAERTDAAGIDALVDALVADPDPAIQLAVSQPQDERARVLAERLFRASDATVNELAAALGRMGTPVATTSLFHALHSPAGAARRAAAMTLWAIGARGAGAAVRTLASSDPDPEVRQACTAVLAG